jgi:hypothetical protein
MIVVTCKREKLVSDLTDPDLMLLTDSQDINSVKEHIGSPEWFDYGCLFVKVEDGDYSEIYGCDRSVPYLNEWVDTIDTERVDQS